MEIINICYDKNFTASGVTNTDIRNIENIPNFSAYRITISFLNKIKKEQSVEIIHQLCNKLRKNGTLTFTLLDFEQLIDFYKNNQLTLEEVTKHLTGIESFIARSEIIKIFHKHPQISIDSIIYDNLYSVYTLSRTDL